MLRPLGSTFHYQKDDNQQPKHYRQIPRNLTTNCILVHSYKGLLDESGVKHNLSPTGAVSEPTAEEADAGAPESGKKPSLGDKIKGKLHIGKK